LLQGAEKENSVKRKNIQMKTNTFDYNYLQMDSKRFARLAFLFLFFALPGISYSQVLAGSVPSGTSIQYPNIHLADSTVNYSVSDSIDIDCNGSFDLAVVLNMGGAVLDEPNSLWLRVLNSSVEVWRDTLIQPNMVQFYNYGDTMCTESYQWHSDPQIRIACGGVSCWFAVSEATDTFIAIRSTATQQIGWIKISYDLLWAYPVTASITEALRFCDEAGVGNISSPLFSLFSDPANNRIINIKSHAIISKFELRNIMGQLLEIIPGDKREINLPATSGVFFITAFNLNGNLHTEKVMKK